MLRPRDPGGGSGIKAKPAEAGFTLIELLVVVIIIGILAAIAIPIFLNQRNQAYDASAKSDLNAAAKSEETYLVDKLTYGAFADLAAAGQTVNRSPGITLSLSYVGASGYCLSAKHSNSPTTWYYDSQGGGLQPKAAPGCPVTTGGVHGGTLTP